MMSFCFLTPAPISIVEKQVVDNEYGGIDNVASMKNVANAFGISQTELKDYFDFKTEPNKDLAMVMMPFCHLPVHAGEM